MKTTSLLKLTVPGSSPHIFLIGAKPLLMLTGQVNVNFIRLVYHHRLDFSPQIRYSCVLIYSADSLFVAISQSHYVFLLPGIITLYSNYTENRWVLVIIHWNNLWLIHFDLLKLSKRLPRFRVLYFFVFMSHPTMQAYTLMTAVRFELVSTNYVCNVSFKWAQFYVPFIGLIIYQ